MPFTWGETLNVSTFIFRKCLNYDKKLTHENNTNQYLDV